MTDGRVEYVTSQEAGAQYAEIPDEEFAGSVQLIESDGRIFRGAEAVFRSLGYSRGGRWLGWCYDRVPGFAPVTEFTYAIVARNRYLASRATRLLWGNDVRQPTYFATRRIFLRALGLIFLIAFVSLWVQIDGLVGSRGISPVAQFLPAAEAQFGDRARSVLPTLVWFNSSDTFLHVLCGTGALFCLLLVAGLVPALALLVLYVTYLSLTIAGQTFLSFQWDILLLETGFLAMFFAPWAWRMRAGADPPVSRAGLFLLKLLLFKLMFMSGVVKLTSGDQSWWDLTALNYHYQTQPLPTVLGWFGHQAPEWLKRFGVGFTHVVEIVVPFLIWAPRRLRLLGCALLILLQVIIALTGNYAFFNLLTIALCLLLIDDSIWPRPRQDNAPSSGVITRTAAYAAVAVLLVTLPLNVHNIYSAVKPESAAPAFLAKLNDRLEPFRIVNGYGLFRVMTKRRPEIIVEGSADGVDWLPYTFRWKPGDLDQAPRWVAPHQPRLDWQMWFAALGTPRQSPWFFGFCEGLLTNSPSVLGLLHENPFPEKPPRFVRGILYEYRFTSTEERRATGNWWKREEKREYVRPVSLSGE